MSNMDKANNDRIHDFLFQESRSERRSSRSGFNSPRARRNIKLANRDVCKIPTCYELPTGPYGLCKECGDLGLAANYALYTTFLDEGMSRQQAMVLAGLAE